MKLTIIDSFKKSQNFLWNLIFSQNKLIENSNSLQRRQYIEDSKVFTLSKEYTFSKNEEIFTNLILNSYDRIKIVRIELHNQDNCKLNINGQKSIIIQKNNYVYQPDKFYYTNDKQEETNIYISVKNLTSQYKSIQINIYYYIENILTEESDKNLDTFDEFSYPEFPVHIHQWGDVSKDGSSVSDLSDVPLYSQQNTFLSTDETGKNLQWVNLSNNFSFKSLNNIPDYDTQDAGKIFKIQSNGIDLELAQSSAITKLSDISGIPFFENNFGKQLIQNDDSSMKFIDVLQKDELFVNGYLNYNKINLYESPVYYINIDNSGSYEEVNEFLLNRVKNKTIPSQYIYSNYYQITCVVDGIFNANQFFIQLKNSLNVIIQTMTNSQNINGKTKIIFDMFTLEENIDIDDCKIYLRNTSLNNIKIYSLQFNQYIQRVEVN